MTNVHNRAPSERGSPKLEKTIDEEMEAWHAPMSRWVMGSAMDSRTSEVDKQLERSIGRQVGQKLDW